MITAAWWRWRPVSMRARLTRVTSVCSLPYVQELHSPVTMSRAFIAVTSGYASEIWAAGNQFPDHLIGIITDDDHGGVITRTDNPL